MKKTALIAAAFAAISAVATAVSPAQATARGEMQAPAYADTDVLAQAGGPGRFPMPLQKRNYYGKQQKPNARITPKVCYERKLVGPQNYVIVRRAC